MLIALALAVATWGGGFDILYALQDVAFDRSQSLYSLPVAFGERRALLLARAFHVCTVACLCRRRSGGVRRHRRRRVLRAWRSRRGRVARLRTLLVKADDFSRLDAAFFTMNGVISIAFFVCGSPSD